LVAFTNDLEGPLERVLCAQVAFQVLEGHAFHEAFGVLHRLQDVQ
jgi:hypothetical protein